MTSTQKLDGGEAFFTAEDFAMRPNPENGTYGAFELSPQGDADLANALVQPLLEENRRLTSDRAAFAQETQQYREAWLSDKTEIKRLKEECGRVFNVDQDNQRLRAFILARCSCKSIPGDQTCSYCEVVNGGERSGK